MESKEVLYKPKDLYQSSLKEQYHKGATDFYDKLTKDNNIDTQANKKHVEEYNTYLKEKKDLEDKIGSGKGFRIFLIVLIVLGFLVGGILMIISIMNMKSLWFLLIIGILLIAGAIYFIVHINVFTNKKLKEKEEELQKVNEKINNKLNECYNDLAPLNNSLDWNIPGTIMEKVTNIIDLDPYFTLKRLCYLKEKFGFQEITDPNCSVLGVLSGNIQGNPFVLQKVLEEKLVDTRYTGTLTIHWTTYSRSNGKTVSHHHSETLKASVYHPAPNYHTQTVLVYGNEAAPNLHFKRTPSDINTLKTDKDKEKAVKNGMKEIKKMADKAISEGKAFTPTGNDDFDVFFGGLDRDNEVEFRLLFTPLAQSNMLSLLNDPTPYGDDFYMTKNGMVNIIASRHSQTFDYSANPYRYITYDYEKGRDNFINYCDKFIEGLYFDLAPLLSIPLYQMHKPREYIYEKELATNYSSFEHETLANAMNQDIFRPNGCDSSLPVLLKSYRVAKVGDADSVIIHGYSYETKPRCDYVSVKGGDGRYHDVPVHWTEYIRKDSEREMDLRYIGSNRKEVNETISNTDLKNVLGRDGQFHYERGLLALCLDRPYTEQTDNLISSFFKEVNEK